MKLTRRHVLGAGATVVLGAASGTAGASAVAQAPSYGDGKITSQLKLSLAAYSFRKYLPRGEKTGSMTMHDLFDLAAVWRLGAIEPTSYFFSSEDRDYLLSLKAKAFHLGLDISGTAVGNNFCLSDASARKAQVQHVKTWVDHSVVIGAPVIRVFCGKKNTEAGRDKTFRWAIDGLKESCDYAGSKGVFLAIENHGYLTEGADDVLKVVDAVNHEWFGINLDTGNFDDHPYRDMARLAPKSINVQAKVTLPTTDGSAKEAADFRRIVGILREANYRGYLVLEYEEAADPMTAVPKYLDELRAAIAS